MLLFRMNPAAKRKGCPTNVGPQDVESRTRCNERHCSICCHQINALTAVPLRKVISVRSLAFPRPTVVWLSTRLCTLPLVANPPQTRFYSLIPLTAPTFGRKKILKRPYTHLPSGAPTRKKRLEIAPPASSWPSSLSSARSSSPGHHFDLPSHRF